MSNLGFDGAKHTRQGCARGQAHGTLDREDPNLDAGGRWAATSYSAMNERDKARKSQSREPKWRTMTARESGCWCGPWHAGQPHAESLPWQLREQRDEAFWKRFAEAVAKMSLVAGKKGVGVAVLCERGIPKFVAPSDQVPLGEIKWFGSVPFIERGP